MLLAVFVLGTTVAGSPAAFALETHPYTGTSFGPAGVGSIAGFSSLQAVTVDQSSGDVFVLDAGEGGKLYKFDATGEPVKFSSLSGNVIEGVGGYEGGNSEGSQNQIAIAPPGAPGGTSGDIYVANNTFGTLSIYGADGQKVGTGELETGGETCGVAVDPAGRLFVGLFGAVVEYTPSVNPPIAADQTGTGTGENGSCNIAVDGLGNVYATNYTGGSTVKLEGITDPSPTLVAEPGGAALAVDSATNELYLDQGPDIAVYSSMGEPKNSFGANGLAQSHGVAVGATVGKVYVANGIAGGKVDVYGPAITLPDITTEAPTGVTKDAATLHGTISAAGGPEASCEFQLTSEAAFNAEGFAGARSLPCAPPGPFTGNGTEAVAETVGDLNSGATYFFRLVGSNANGSNPDRSSKDGALSFRTTGPSILASSVSGVIATAATVSGVIDTNNGTDSYRVEYGPTASYGLSQPVPDAEVVPPVGQGDFQEGRALIENVALSQGNFYVGQEIVGVGIRPGTTITNIEFRQVSLKGRVGFLTLSQPVEFGNFEVMLTSPTAAVSQRLRDLLPGTGYHYRLVATGAGVAAGPDGTFTTLAPSVALPDGRAYEMVTPAQKLGEVVTPEPNNALGGTCTACLPGIPQVSMPMQARPDGDAVASLGQPFSRGLAPGLNQYLSQRAPSGWSTGSIIPPLLPANDVSGFKSLSIDLDRGVVQQTAPALSADVPSGEGGNTYEDLYLWEAGNPNLRPLVTSKPPHRDPHVAGENTNGTNGFRLAFAGANSGGEGGDAFEHLVFEANDTLTGAVPGIAPPAPEAEPGVCGGSPNSGCDLYEWVGGQLRLINVLPGNEVAAPRAVVGSGLGLARHPSSNPKEPSSQAPDVDHAISTDGSRIFWSDEAGQVYVRIDGRETVKIDDPGRFLTASANGSKVLLSDGCLYNLAASTCEAALTKTSTGLLGIMGASVDLSRIYFVSTEALAPGATSGSCETPENGPAIGEEEEGKVPAGRGCNLYVFDHGEVSFIATINEGDDNIGEGNNYGGWRASPSNRTAQVTPDGRYLAFMSFARLTQYDNHCSDAVAAQCFRGATRPTSPNSFEVYEYDLASKMLSCPSCNPTGEKPLGPSSLSLIKPLVTDRVGTPFKQPENLPAAGEGRLFFQSLDKLAGKDTNGAIQDVYEWTPDAVGGCTRAQGCVALISSGHSPGDSFFLGSTPSADDAFFVTRERLLPQDEDQLLDLYDARVGGGFESIGTSQCDGEGCKAPPPPPPPLLPGSAKFVGPANPKPTCRRGRARRHGRCVKAKHHKRHDGRKARPKTQVVGGGHGGVK